MKTKIKHHSARSGSRGILACFSIVLLTGLGLASSRAEDVTAVAPVAPGAPMLSHADKHFMQTAAMASAHELALSQVAADHAASPDVKGFAQDMITAHRQLNGDLQALAGRQSIDITASVKKGEDDGVSSLAEKSGRDFDRAYIKEMVAGHTAAVSLFQKETTAGKDAEVVALATQYLPIVSEHLQHATTLQRSLDQ
jgi:putative membrane protein